MRLEVKNKDNTLLNKICNVEYLHLKIYDFLDKGL